MCRKAHRNLIQKDCENTNGDSGKMWLREREMDPCEYPPVPFQFTAGSPREPSNAPLLR